jgi:hypothetical protein
MFEEKLESLRIPNGNGNNGEKLSEITEKERRLNKMDSSLMFIIIFCIGMFFQALAFRMKDEIEGTICMLFSAILWFVTGIIWIYVEHSTYPEFSYFFWALGMVDVVLTFKSSFKPMYERATRRSRRGRLIE